MTQLWQPSVMCCIGLMCCIGYQLSKELNTSFLTSNQGRTHLHSAALGDSSVAANKGTTYGGLSFAVYGPTTWNTLSLQPVINISISNSFTVVSRQNYFIEHIMLLSLSKHDYCEALAWQFSSI